MYTANAADEAGNTLNVKWTVAGNMLGYVYGYLDEKTNSFIVPQQYTNDGAAIDLGAPAGQSPVLFTGVSTNDRFCNFVAMSLRLLHVPMLSRLDTSLARTTKARMIGWNSSSPFGWITAQLLTVL